MRTRVLRGLAWATGVSAFIPFALSATSPAVAQSVVTIRDEFRSVSYGGNEGSASFSGPWIERGESDGPSSGVLRVAASDRCAGGTGNCLYLGREGGSFESYAIDRAVDLDDAIEATFTFRWRRASQGQVGGAVQVRVSGDGGSSWTTLTTIALAGSQRSASESFDIASWAASSTVIRFDGTGSDVDGFLAVDDVQVAATVAETTTTSPTSTTTTTPGSTTTAPGGTTTTTLPNSTTTVPDADPTTTLAGTTTTVPGVTSATEPIDSRATTTVAGGTNSSVPNVSGLASPTSTTTATNVGTERTGSNPTSAGSDERATTTAGPNATSTSDDASDETPNALIEIGPSEPSDGPPLMLVGAQVLILGGLVVTAALTGVVRDHPPEARATRSTTRDR